MKLLAIEPSRKALKKYDAVFEVDGKIKRVSFGALRETGEPYSDFTQHKDEERKQRYLSRHSATENWNNPLTPGALSRWILWNKPTLQASIVDFKKRFHLLP